MANKPLIDLNYRMRPLPRTPRAPPLTPCHLLLLVHCFCFAYKTCLIKLTPLVETFSPRATPY